MHRYDPGRQKLALGLAFLAGQTDAIGFIVAGGYFTSFMSGNTTRLGVDLIENPAVAYLPVVLIASFLGGVVAGSLVIGKWQRRRKTVLLTIVASVLGAAAIAAACGLQLVFLTLAAAAMGAANNSFSRDGEVTVGVTYMTGALVRFGQGIAARLSGRSTGTMRGYGALWAALAAGAASGAGLHSLSPTGAPAACFVIAVLLCLGAYRVERNDS
ncbi:hypothetical protein AMC99_02575 [Altererythrobacter epoxidivorans]|uniref:DUF1275 domain-containing protein n=1 Tax=Altererythrobacter epoxidivorans TaxID=361183 RepID=A0A0M4MA64_9SPHN|nr:DUF1275 family protein [Altererythrobacter epoxidivorans]ALE17848.1 hypothetical protein AMC99_02575 [Altererythrobacter epoxidivorans]